MTNGRYFSPRDMRLVDSFNKELLFNMIQTEVVIYRISPTETSVNIYGEVAASSMKIYYKGIRIGAYVDRGELSTTPDDFIDKKQGVVFKFLYSELKNLNIFLQEGDLIDFNHRIHQIDNVIGNDQLIGGQPLNSFSIICNSHYSRLSVNELNFVDQQ
jgi:hypothetical protein